MGWYGIIWYNRSVSLPSINSKSSKALNLKPYDYNILQFDGFDEIYIS